MERGHRPSRHRRQEVAASEPPAASERGLSLRELTAAADVSVRTVRYYISEGLLPPPEGAGSASSYTRGHLDRLRLIARLKGSYLPLKEIRHRLAGLDDIAVHRLLGDEEAPAPHPPPDSAAAYLDRALGSRQAPTAPQSAPPGTRPEGVWGMQASAPLRAAETSPPPALFSAGADEPAPPPVPGYPTPNPILGRAYPAAFGVPDAEEPAEAEPSAPDAWRRVSLGDDAELLIRESAYTRRRDRVDWLIAWARKVFG